jgi:hypothetical protein
MPISVRSVSKSSGTSTNSIEKYAPYRRTPSLLGDNDMVFDDDVPVKSIKKFQK